MQSRQTLEIVHNFGRARGHGPHLHVYKAFAARIWAMRATTRLTAMPVPKMQRRSLHASQDVFVILKKWTDGAMTTILRMTLINLSGGISSLKAMNDRAGLKTFPGAHKDRNPKYGLMQHGSDMR